mmetsp:Transcript_3605/g.10531  ORF Transcript_3605/g.10531 Transcript_3605/m.10531 type:complete len:83 (-) Transcript_3605:237-485(-)
MHFGVRCLGASLIPRSKCVKNRGSRVCVAALKSYFESFLKDLRRKSVKSQRFVLDILPVSLSGFSLDKVCSQPPILRTFCRP